MELLKVILICAGASIDVFVASICKGFELQTHKFKTAIICGIWFTCSNLIIAGFGYFIGWACEFYVAEIDHWITFILFSIIGSKTIWDAYKPQKPISQKVNFRSMCPLAFVCGIDMFFVGLTYSFFDIKIFVCMAIIVLFSLASSISGVFIGQKINQKNGTRLLILGGIILILIGLINLIQHLFFY